MEPRSRVSSRGLRTVLITLVLVGLAALAWVNWPRLQPTVQPWLEQRGITLPAGQPDQVLQAAASATLPATPTATPSPSDIPAVPSDTAIPIASGLEIAPEDNLSSQGVLVMAMRDGPFIHLYAYHPLFLPFSRLTNNPWDDVTPALSPDGTRLAYSSRQNGYWDLYILDLSSGKKTRVTDTPEFEASPTWSPDGLWIAYEKYNGVSLDVYIQPLDDPSSLPIQLTDDPGIDRAPAWSPKGREIAFVSSRTGDEEIWLARLDNIDDRFVNISQSPLTQDTAPTWSPDGSFLAWASEQEGNRKLVSLDTTQDGQRARPVGEGDLAAWTPDGRNLFSLVRDANQSGLAAYSTITGRLSQPFIPLSGAVYGMTWIKGPLPAWFAETLRIPDTIPVPTLWEPALTRTVSPAGRMGLVELVDVTAPQAMMHDSVDEAFTSLRQQAALETGWDVLSSLENAYLPLTAPPVPSIYNDWLYTGRAFALNPLLLSANWMAITREDFNGQTYWRVYLKARYQDGSMGMPLSKMVWDLNARFSGDPTSYEEGGKPGQVPPGYWIDLTELATRYSWERLPSWINWRTFYPSIRYNQFVITGDLEWRQAMSQLYPPEALVTTTPQPTLTPVPSRTSEVRRSGTQTPTPTLTSIPTRRPTWTPLPGQDSP